MIHSDDWHDAPSPSAMPSKWTQRFQSPPKSFREPTHEPETRQRFRPFVPVAVPEVALRISVQHDGFMTTGRMTMATGARDSWIFTTRLGKRREVATTGDREKKKGNRERECNVTQFLRSFVQTRKMQQLLRIFFPPRIQISCHPSNSNKSNTKLLQFEIFECQPAPPL